MTHLCLIFQGSDWLQRYMSSFFLVNCLILLSDVYDHRLDAFFLGF